ncbi:division/cell wall cluster transcriptional repressor MraZ [Oceanibacterium hippocampi]|uniref:Transcriptional regulator MraZ n=1 Tax=Oceanibacterium hippocampi TaxID=745714 RepID=A0A1Y5SGJ1_9PROT|nr:division/cell wall cluster transcriptional repressor MraZ [Oceanibacterium hippocampi]SLN37202.1 cell division protein MraZ [Oceanibacterium hippocampi]
MFVSNFTNRIDKKWRVSVPARYRAILSEAQDSVIYAYPHPTSPSIVCSGIGPIRELQASIGKFNPLSQDFDDFADALLSQIEEMSWDNEGRVVLPENLRIHAGLSDSCVFAGRGDTFHIWEPAAFQRRLEEARRNAQSRRDQLSRITPPGGSGA